MLNRITMRLGSFVVALFSVFAYELVHGQDMHCGPRAARDVLRYFGEDPGLLELVQEIDRPTLDSVSSMKAVAELLSAHGLATCALHSGSPVATSDLPYIAHGALKDGEPHFEAVLPGHRPRQLATLSGYILVVSLEAIPPESIPLTFENRWQTALIGISLATMMVSLFGICRSVSSWKMRSPGSLQRSVLALALLIGIPANAMGVEESEKEVEELEGAKALESLRFVLAGLEAARNTPVSGAFSGTHRVEREGQVVEQSEIFCAFDWAEDLFRFDRTSWQIVEYDGTITEKGGSYVRLPDRQLKWQLNGPPSIYIYPPEKDLRYVSKPFDYRLLGLLFPVEARFKKTVHDWLSDFNAFFNNPRSPKPTVVHRDSIWEFNWGVGIRLQNSLIIDEEKDFAIVSHASRSRAKADDSLPWSTNVDIAIKSELIGGYWLPTDVKMAGEQGSAIEFFELSWQSADFVDQDLFSFEGMSRPEVSRLVDVRLGDPVVVQEVELDLNTDSPVEIATRSRLTKVFFGANAVVIVALFCGWIFYWRKRA